MLMEIDEVAVLRADWEAMLTGDKDAMERIRKTIDGLFLYAHALPVDEMEQVVTLRDLEKYNVIEGVSVVVSEYETERKNAKLRAACQWLVDYHGGPCEIVTMDEYLSRAREALLE